MTALFCMHGVAQQAAEPSKEKGKLSQSFLEYLAELKQVDGNWVGPLDMQMLPDEIAEQDQSHDKKDKSAAGSKQQSSVSKPKNEEKK